MENNEFNNNEETKLEEAVVQEPNKSKKKTAIILVIGLVVFVAVVAFGIGVFWVKSYDGTSKTGHTESPFKTDNNSKVSDDTEVTKNTTKDISTSSDPEACGVSLDNYVEDAEVKDIAHFMHLSISEPETNTNIIGDPKNRLRYLELMLMSNGKSSETKDDSTIYGQPLQTISYNDFADEFNSIYGNNYDLTQTITDLGNNYAIFNRCESKPSVNDGNHVCWMGTSISTCKYFFEVSDKKTNNSTYTVNGKYHWANDVGTFEFTYTLSGNNKYLKSVVLTKTN